MERSPHTPLSHPSSSFPEHDTEDAELAEAIRLSLLPNEIHSNDSDGLLEEAIRLSLQPCGYSDGDEQAFQSAIRLSLAKCPGPLVNSPSTRSSKPRNIDHTQFRYTPLQSKDDFRIIRLNLAQDPKHRLEFDLITANLDSSALPLYTTLSYAWGETYADGSHLTETVKCCGKILQVTSTVHQALRRIWETEKERDPDQLVLLWIDAICINQDDIKERETQVERMADIYARCTRMIIWLGEHSQSALEWIERLRRTVNYPTPTELGLGTLPTLRSDLISSKKNHMIAELLVLLRTFCVEMPHPDRLRDFLRGSLYSCYAAENALPETDPAFNYWARQIVDRFAPSFKNTDEAASSNELLSRAWFKRKWVIQEVARSSTKIQTVLIANKTIALQDIVIELRRHSLLESVPAVGATAHNSTLLNNLARYRNTLSSNPQDHIYALVGISNDCSWVAIDYTLGASELYTQVANYYISTGNAIALFALATVKRSTHGLPTWVPDWREDSDYSRCATHADALNTLAIQAHKLFESKRSNRGNAEPHFGDTETRILDLRAWPIRRCTTSNTHNHDACMKCLLLDQALDLASPVTTASSRPLSKGKAPTSAHRVSPGEKDLHAMRQAQARAKWGAIIREQFEEVMYPEEVLCLLQDSPFGFVLRPTDDGHSSGDLRTFSLGYCFQVDEEGWSSEWFSNILGEDRLEWISLI